MLFNKEYSKLAPVQSNKRNFIILTKHRRWQRLWQFFFTGWGLVMVVALVAGALSTRQLLWTPISAINMQDIVSNQFKMTGAVFAGVDKNGEPFRMRAQSARQEYGNPDVIYMNTVSGTLRRVTDGKKVTDNIVAKTGEYNNVKKIVTLRGDVRVDSSTGDKIRTQELVIRL